MSPEVDNHREITAQTLWAETYLTMLGSLLTKVESFIHPQENNGVLDRIRNEALLTAGVACSNFYEENPSTYEEYSSLSEDGYTLQERMFSCPACEEEQPLRLGIFPCIGCGREIKIDVVLTEGEKELPPECPKCESRIHVHQVPNPLCTTAYSCTHCNIVFDHIDGVSTVITKPEPKWEAVSNCPHCSSNNLETLKSSTSTSQRCNRCGTIFNRKGQDNDETS